VPLSVGVGRAGYPSNTMSSWPRPTALPSGILIHLAVWPQETWAEKYGLRCPFQRAGRGRHVTHVAGAEAYLRTKWFLDPFSCLATIDTGHGL